MSLFCIITVPKEVDADEMELSQLPLSSLPVSLPLVPASGPPESKLSLPQVTEVAGCLPMAISPDSPLVNIFFYCKRQYGQFSKGGRLLFPASQVFRSEWFWLTSWEQELLSRVSAKLLKGGKQGLPR